MYPKISKFDLAKLRKVEFLQMMKNIRTHVECFGTNVLGISLFSTSSQPCWIRRLPPLEMERSNTYSQAIDEGDQLRDSACRVSYYFVKAFIFSSHPQLKETADQLMRVLRDVENPLTAGLTRKTPCWKTQLPNCARSHIPATSVCCKQPRC